MGDDSLGNAILEELDLNNNAKKFEIHTIYNEKCKFIGEHEDTHLLSLPLGLSIYLFCEGLVQYMENSFMNRDLHQNAKELLLDNRLYPLDFLLSNDRKRWNQSLFILKSDPLSNSLSKHMVKINSRIYTETPQGITPNLKT